MSYPPLKVNLSLEHPHGHNVLKNPGLYLLRVFPDWTLELGLLLVAVSLLVEPPRVVGAGLGRGHQQRALLLDALAGGRVSVVPPILQTRDLLGPNQFISKQYS